MLDIPSYLLGRKKGGGPTAPIAIIIDSNSTNSEVAGAKAVYDYGQTLCSSNNYSTEEQRIGTWIDGKPLYRRVMIGVVPTTSVDGNYSTITADIADNIDFAYIELQLAKRTDNMVVNLPRLYANFSSRVYTQSNCSITGAKKLQISNTTTELNGGTYYVWVNYTKTTDTATRSLNLTKGENTSSLVGMDDRTELTGIDVGNTEQVEKVNEQAENISAEPIEAIKIEAKTDESGDTI